MRVSSRRFPSLKEHLHAGIEKRSEIPALEILPAARKQFFGVARADGVQVAAQCGDVQNLSFPDLFFQIVEADNRAFGQRERFGYRFHRLPALDFIKLGNHRY